MDRTQSHPVALSEYDQTRPRLDVIRERGSIRVGYSTQNLPFAFRNDQGEVVGFDMEMMHELARNLELTIELHFVRDIDNDAQLLASGGLDIVVGGRIITPQRALDVSFSDDYMQKTVAFMVKDRSRGQ